MQLLFCSHFAVWLAVLLPLCSSTQDGDADVNFQKCEDDSPPYKCINCISELDRCACSWKHNVCCCEAPRGHFARGFNKVACPGGSYQDQHGAGWCQLCNGTDALYNMHARGAVGLEDCEMALCDVYCSGSNDTDACQQACVTPRELFLAMTGPQRNVSFCARLGIESASCTWHSSALRPKAIVGAVLAACLAWMSATAQGSR
mmetsp:Transcript_6394/g.15458  ORF Transcript_6394/g.15458 Transcript_6394/m.15458 type:complete len:203 (-) Transcript_6394:192-800(-)